MKVRIYEDQDGTFLGCTDIRIKKKFDGEPEGTVGFGKIVEKALEETINNFLDIIKEDYPNER